MKSSWCCFSVKETTGGIVGSTTAGFMGKRFHVFVDVFCIPANRESKSDDDFELVDSDLRDERDTKATAEVMGFVAECCGDVCYSARLPRKKAITERLLN